jgi:hypothetical protein
MKSIISVSFILMMIMLASCEVIGDIFSAGFYAGIFVVVAIIAIIIWVIARLGKR